VTPVFRSREHDTLVLCRGDPDMLDLLPPPAATGVVDAALALFSSLLPHQDLAVIERYVTILIESTRSPRLDRNAGRKSAVFINAIAVINSTLRLAVRADVRRARDTFGSQQIGNPLSVVLRVCRSLCALVSD
jgi:hypothetical protein